MHTWSKCRRACPGCCAACCIAQSMQDGVVCCLLGYLTMPSAASSMLLSPALALHVCAHACRRPCMLMRSKRVYHLTLLASSCNCTYAPCFTADMCGLMIDISCCTAGHGWSAPVHGPLRIIWNATRHGHGAGGHDAHGHARCACA